MFQCGGNKGFSITFENGNTVSVQWGPSNYCEPDHPEGRNAPFDAPASASTWKAKNAEVAAWDKDGNWHKFDFDDVEGWQNGDEVANFIHFVANNELKTIRDDDED